jgi:urease accessory protein
MGELSAAFRDSPRGTILATQASRMPLRAVRAFALASGERVLQIVHVGPGVMGGDRLRIDLRADEGARAIVIAQAATKLHAMPSAAATQEVTLRVAEGASLEVHPGLTIPFAGSAFAQRVTIDVAATGRLAYLERVAVGRIARGERHAYRYLRSRLQLRHGGRAIFADALEWTPEDAAAVGVMEDFDVMASGVFIGGTPPALPDVAGVRAAAFAVSEHAWLYRALAHDGVALRAAAAAVVAGWRGHDGFDADRFGS